MDVNQTIIHLFSIRNLGFEKIALELILYRLQKERIIYGFVRSK